MNATRPQEVPPKVSVVMLTYRHEKFITQAIESVLMQKTDFPFELLIGEDKSPDATRRIVEAYERRHPGKIRLLAREQNLGMMRNFVDTYLRCRGTYVALLEGDDYWTCAQKLQLQADALDAHPDWVICFHTVRFVTDDGSRPSYLFPSGRPEVSTLDDLMEQNFMQTCSLMFRNGVVRSFPDWYFSLPVGDWPLSIMMAQHGRVGYLDRVMADYRIHPGGVWAGRDPRFQLEQSLRMLGQVRQILDPERAARLAARIARGYVELAGLHADAGDPSKARAALWGQRRFASALRRGFPHKHALREVLRIEAPIILRALQWLRRLSRSRRARNL